MDVELTNWGWWEKVGVLAVEIHDSGGSESVGEPQPNVSKG